MLALLVYAYANKVLSSRRIEALCAVDVAFRVICAGDIPDHVTLARFRRKNLAAFEDLFARVLVLCAQAGMARVGTVAIDGTKSPLGRRQRLRAGRSRRGSLLP